MKEDFKPSRKSLVTPSMFVPLSCKHLHLARGVAIVALLVHKLV